MTTPRVTQVRPPWWRFLILMGCCEILPFTRGGFGRQYYSLLFFALLLRAVLLLPCPTARTYAHFQLAVAFVMIMHLEERVRGGRREFYLARDVYDPGRPCWLLFLLRRRSIFFLFLLEPVAASFAALLLRASSPFENLWTEPFFMAFVRQNPDVASVFDLPHFLRAWLVFGNGILEHADPTLIANGLLVSLPFCAMLNSIAEYRAEHAATPVPATPKNNAPVLTFPKVRV